MAVPAVLSHRFEPAPVVPPSPPIVWSSRFRSARSEKVNLPPPDFAEQVVKRLVHQYEQEPEVRELALLKAKIEERTPLTGEEVLQLQELTKNDPDEAGELFGKITSFRFHDFNHPELGHILQRCPNLQNVSLIACDIIDKIEDQISGLIHLEILNLSHSARGVSVAMLKKLSNLKKLQQLKLSHCGSLSDNELRALKQLITLQALDLSECSQITDQGLKALTALIHLKTLDLSGCSTITDRGLKILENLPNLQVLNITYCNRELITYEGIQNLRKARPGIQVFGLHQ